MRSFRGLGDIPDRMGLTLEEGQRVTNLPYAEGQLLVTLVDDWRNLRCRPQVATYGSRILRAAGGAATFATLALVATRLPLRLIYCDVEVTGAIISNPVIVQRGEETSPIVAVATASVLEGAGSGSTFPEPATAEFRDHGTPALTFGGVFSFLLRQTTFTFGRGYGDWLPRILLPGETLKFRAPVNQAIEVNLAWEEYPTMTDVVTSQAKSVQLDL